MIKQLCSWFAWSFLATGAIGGCSQSIQQASNTPTRGLYSNGAESTVKDFAFTVPVKPS